MELKLKQPTLPEVIEFNFEELKAEITEQTGVYVGMVYTDDQIKTAKSDAAMLRKFTKALFEERVRVKKEFLKPYEDFEKKVKELTEIADKAINNIDGQIKAFDQKKKEEKKEQIRNIFLDANLPVYITFEKIFDESWLNSSCTMSRIKEEIKTIAYRDEKATKTIGDLPEGAFEAMEYYKESLDVVAALAKANDIVRMNRAKKAAEEEKAKQIPFTDQVEEPIEEQRQWVKFEALLSVNEAMELNAFFKTNGINFRAVKN